MRVPRTTGFPVRIFESTTIRSVKAIVNDLLGLGDLLTRLSVSRLRRRARLSPSTSSLGPQRGLVCFTSALPARFSLAAGPMRPGQSQPAIGMPLIGIARHNCNLNIFSRLRAALLQARFQTLQYYRPQRG